MFGDNGMILQEQMWQSDHLDKTKKEKKKSIRNTPALKRADRLDVI